MLSAKDVLNKKDFNFSANVSNFNQLEKPKNDQLYSNNINHSPISNVYSKNNPNNSINYTDNLFKNNFNNGNLTTSSINNNLNNNNESNRSKYRNGSMEINNNINNNQVSSFNLNENANFSKENKIKFFKPLIGKNALLPNNKLNIYANNKIGKNNFNLSVDMSPLKNSITIEKLNKPAQNKPSNNQSLNRFNNTTNNNNNIIMKGGSIVNPFNLNAVHQNDKFIYSIKNKKNSENFEIENKLANKISNNNNNVRNQIGNFSILNEENKTDDALNDYPVQRRKRSISDNDFIGSLKNDENFTYENLK